MSKTKTISYETRAHFFWFMVGISVLSLFVYFYAINSIAQNTALRQNLEARVADAAGRVGGLEFSYIELRNSITFEMAKNYGFKEVRTPLYVTRHTSSTLTLNR